MIQALAWALCTLPVFSTQAPAIHLDRWVGCTQAETQTSSTSESQEIVEQLSGKNLSNEYIDPLIVAQKIEDSYALLRESLQPSSAPTLPYFYAGNYMERTASTSSTLGSRRQLKTKSVEKIETTHSAPIASDPEFICDNTGIC